MPRKPTVPPASRFIGQLGDFALYQTFNGKGSMLWLKMKLVAPNIGKRKGIHRAYYLSWSLDEQRFARKGWPLFAQRPELFAEVEALAKKEFPPEYATADDGLALSETELAAERAGETERIAKRNSKKVSDSTIDDLL